MASHIDCYSPKDLAMVGSREKYEELRAPLEYIEEVGGRYTHNEIRKAWGYIHERTGLITTDIRKFEKWLKKVEGK